MHMLPQSFLSRMHSLLGADYPAASQSMEEAPVRGLRVNPLKAVSAPADIEIKPLPFSGGGYIFFTDFIGHHPLHHAGAASVQDPSAISTVAAASHVLRQGMRILDLCAAPGGKSTRLAGVLQGTGMLVANAIAKERCRVLRSEYRAYGCENAPWLPLLIRKKSLGIIQIFLILFW